MVWAWGEQGALLSLLDEAAIPTCAALDDPDFVWIDVSRDMPYRCDNAFLFTSISPFIHPPHVLFFLNLFFPHVDDFPEICFGAIKGAIKLSHPLRPFRLSFILCFS